MSKQRRTPKVVKVEMEDEPTEPEDQDFVLTNYGRLGEKTLLGLFGGESLGIFLTEDAAKNAIRAYAKEHRWFPNVWYLDDHGGWHLFTDFQYKREVKEE